MSNVERRLAKNILDHVTPQQAETVETDNPRFALLVKALSRHMTGGRSDDLTEFAITALVQRILPHKYETALRLQDLEDIDAKFDLLAQSIEAETSKPINTEVISQKARQSQPLIDYLKAGPID